MITDLLHRRRLLFWLIRAYVKKRKRTIGSFFVAGIFVALIGYLLAPRLLPLIPLPTKSVGMVGSYTIETLPIDIQNKLSLGLTHIAENGEASPSAASEFTVSNDGKTYAFMLRDDLFWQDGKKFTASDINYNFKDVEIQVRSENEVVFVLKEPFAPFPSVVHQPLFRKGLVGLGGTYKVIHIVLNGEHVSELSLEGTTGTNKKERITYKFFASEEEAKIRFMLGEVGELTNLVDPSQFQGWKNVKVSKETSYNQLVTLFYNTSFPLLSDKSVRQALTYALAHEFADGESASSPLSSKSWAFAPQNKFAKEDLGAARKLLSESKEASQSGKLTLVLATVPHFKNLASQIATDWGAINVDTQVRVVDMIPPDAQVVLERFRIPTDPDQYVLWHSTQETNVSRFANPKIDKLLEDGRQTTNSEERLQIYTDFQRYIVDESPAAFLYYPTVYTISRK